MVGQRSAECRALSLMKGIQKDWTRGVVKEMEYFIADCKGYDRSNNTAWSTSHRSPDVKKAPSWSPSPAQSFTMWDMVCGHLIFQGQVNKRKYMRTFIHARQVFKGCADDSTIRCETVADRLHRWCWNTQALSHGRRRGVHQQSKAGCERGVSHADTVTHHRIGS